MQVALGIHVEHEGEEALRALAVEMRRELLEPQEFGVWIGQNLVDIDGEAPGTAAMAIEQMVEPSHPAAEHRIGVGGQIEVRIRAAEQIVARPVVRAVVDHEEAVHALAAIEVEEPGQTQMLVAQAREQADLASGRRDGPVVQPFQMEGRPAHPAVEPNHIAP